jgi:NAD(P)-dependent dehydrogenase (short-subunit alcohol dehydrogenase family)
VSGEANVAKVISRGAERYGRIDILHNNIGIVEVCELVNLDEADWDHVFAVNLKGCFLAMMHVIPIIVR